MRRGCFFYMMILLLFVLKVITDDTFTVVLANAPEGVKEDPF